MTALQDVRVLIARDFRGRTVQVMNSTLQTARFVVTVDGVLASDTAEVLVQVFEGSLKPSRVVISLGVLDLSGD